jgi:superfamily II RNA helicase
LHQLEDHASTVEPALAFLRSLDYLTAESADTKPSLLTARDLTLRGILATEVNEGHPILLTELFLSRQAHDLDGPELATVLSAFLEDFNKELTITVDYVRIPEAAKKALRHLVNSAKEFQAKEDGFYKGVGRYDNYWNTTIQWSEVIYWWVTDPEAAHLSVICQEYGLFEGNLVRSLLKLANLLDEWLSLATFCEHADQIEKVAVLRPQLVRGLAVPDSLYLKA